MLIKPISRGFICTTAHPEGCARNVAGQISHVTARPRIIGAKRALVIGSSTGYGLASRIVAAFGMGADTLGVFLEKPSEEGRTATAGWYSTAAFERAACGLGTRHASLNGDAFSDELKARAIEVIKRGFDGGVDLVVYSLAAPRRTDSRTGRVHSSVLKPIGKPYKSKTVHFQTGQVSEVVIEPASEEDIQGTVAVMGGEAWASWIDALSSSGALAKGAKTVAYSYIGPEATRAVYREGSIGRAKDDLEKTALALDAKLKPLGGGAVVSVNKALVTQASAAIPVVPLYIALLTKVMKAKCLDEGCIEQMQRLFADHVYSAAPGPRDPQGRIRVDDREMRTDVQAEVHALWDRVTTENIGGLSDLRGYHDEFFRLFGFGLSGVDYDQDVDADVPIPSLSKVKEVSS
jgi:enoyl-[acyl-carrier protein] reductase / trans-2-enoyl-CoA reductase (NAD+)